MASTKKYMWLICDDEYQEAEDVLKGEEGNVCVQYGTMDDCTNYLRNNYGS